MSHAGEGVSAPLDGPIAVLVSRFPAVSETFILRELCALERAGVEVVLVPLLRDRVSTLHAEAEPWDARALYTPFLDRAILAANLRVLQCRPRLWIGTLLALLWEARKSANAWLGTVVFYLKSVYNGARVRDLGVRHLHAHFATHPATAAYVMSRVHDGRGPELPFSITVHAHDIQLTSAGLRRKLTAAAFVRAISEFNRRDLIERFASGAPALVPEKVCVIHCGVETDRYAHRTRAPGAGRARPARLLCVASHRPYKGLTHLIEAVRRLRESRLDVECEVIGEGELRPRLEAQIRAARLEAHVRLVGTRPQEAVAYALAESDLFVLPSVVAPSGQMEGIPVSLMEALAAELPSVASRLSGIPELVIDGETGWLVPPGDAQALADTIARILDDPEEARRRAEAGRRHVLARFDVRRCTSELVEALRPHLAC